MSKCSECGNSPCDCEEKPKTIIRITKGVRRRKSDVQDIPSGCESCSECEGRGNFSETRYEYDDEPTVAFSEAFNIVDEWIINNPDYSTDYPQLAVLSQLLTIGRSTDGSAQSMYDAISACFVGIEEAPPIPRLAGKEIEEIEECENCKGEGFVERIEECCFCNNSFPYGKFKRCCRPNCSHFKSNFICKICFKMEKENQFKQEVPNAPWCESCRN
jgi:hypothetical protein